MVPALSRLLLSPNKRRSNRRNNSKSQPSNRQKNNRLSRKRKSRRLHNSKSQPSNRQKNNRLSSSPHSSNHSNRPRAHRNRRGSQSPQKSRQKKLVAIQKLVMEPKIKVRPPSPRALPTKQLPQTLALDPRHSAL